MGARTALETNDEQGRRRWARPLVAGALVVAGVGALGGGALAAAVAPSPFPGPTNCGALHQRFGGDSPWTEIRFSTLPDEGGSKTAKAKGVTVTVTRTGLATFDWRASGGIDLVWVNAGEPPVASSAAYRYDPPREATADRGLSGTNGQDPLDHVLFCFDEDAPPSTTATTAVTTPPTSEAPATTAAPPTTEAPATTPPTSAPPATTRPPTVRSLPEQENPVPQATPVPRQVTPTTAPAPARLPETGSSSGPLLGLGLLLVGLGVVSMAWTRKAPDAA